jgi:hypothetical protein
MKELVLVLSLIVFSLVFVSGNELNIKEFGDEIVIDKDLIINGDYDMGIGGNNSLYYELIMMINEVYNNSAYAEFTINWPNATIEILTQVLERRYGVVTYEQEREWRMQNNITNVTLIDFNSKVLDAFEAMQNTQIWLYFAVDYYNWGLYNDSERNLNLSKYEYGRFLGVSDEINNMFDSWNPWINNSMSDVNGNFNDINIVIEEMKVETGDSNGKVNLIVEEKVERREKVVLLGEVEAGEDSLKVETMDGIKGEKKDIKRENFIIRFFGRILELFGF